MLFFLRFGFTHGRLVNCFYLSIPFLWRWYSRALSWCRARRPRLQTERWSLATEEAWSHPWPIKEAERCYPNKELGALNELNLVLWQSRALLRHLAWCQKGGCNSGILPEWL